MPYHQHHQHRPQVVERDAQAVETVVSVVWVTADPEEPAVAASTPTTAATHRENGQPIQNTRQLAQAESSSTRAPYSAPPRQQRPYTSATPVAASSTELALAATSAAVATSKAVGSPVAQQPTTLYPSYVSADVTTGVAANTYVATAPVAGATYASDTADPIDGAPIATSTNDSGMSTGAKAGIAAGAILGAILLAVLAIFLIRRKKNQNKEHQRLDDEKSMLHKRSQSVASHVSVGRSKTNAPRLSLRPVTQMFPGQQMSEKQAGNGLAPGGAAFARSRTPEPASHNPFGDDENKSVIATPVAAAAPTPVTAKLEQMSQQTPREESQAFPGAPAGSRRNSPPGPGQNNVHRVQLEFKPSMDDELELRAGSLVRMLHEYDDGWALCIRLDRSQQGVVPRTCISKLPVKPRPGPPPGARSGPPQGRPRAGSNASHSSNGSQPRMSPPNGAVRPGPPPGARIRAQSNAPRRPQSPAQYARGPQNGRPRANSDAMSARRITPPSPMSSSPMSSAPSSPPQPQAPIPARKPVPGQAM